MDVSLRNETETEKAKAKQAEQKIQPVTAEVVSTTTFITVNKEQIKTKGDLDKALEMVNRLDEGFDELPIPIVDEGSSVPGASKLWTKKMHPVWKSLSKTVKMLNPKILKKSAMIREDIHTYEKTHQDRRFGVQFQALEKLYVESKTELGVIQDQMIKAGKMVQSWVKDWVEGVVKPRKRYDKKYQKIQSEIETARGLVGVIQGQIHRKEEKTKTEQKRRLTTTDPITSPPFSQWFTSPRMVRWWITRNGRPTAGEILAKWKELNAFEFSVPTKSTKKTEIPLTAGQAFALNNFFPPELLPGISNENEKGWIFLHRDDIYGVGSATLVGSTFARAGHLVQFVGEESLVNECIFTRLLDMNMQQIKQKYTTKEEAAKILKKMGVQVKISASLPKSIKPKPDTMGVLVVLVRPEKHFDTEKKKQKLWEWVSNTREELDTTPVRVCLVMQTMISKHIPEAMYWASIVQPDIEETIWEKEPDNVRDTNSGFYGHGGTVLSERVQSKLQEMVGGGTINLYDPFVAQRMDEADNPQSRRTRQGSGHTDPQGAGKDR